MANDQAVAKVEATQSERFTAMVIRQFGTTVGRLALTPLQKQLAEHLFIKIDQVLPKLEAKRDKGKADRTVIAWENINQLKLAVDSVYRIDLGLDALIENHIDPIPYWNTAEKRYDLELRIGYAGEDYYRQEMALNQPLGIIYELVYSSDSFKPIKRSATNPVESYQFDIPKPFDRGNVIGGFGYVYYENQAMNFLVIVTEKEFLDSEKRGNKDFWGPHPIPMRYKTLVRRTTAKLGVDPRKVNVSYIAVEAQRDDRGEDEIQDEIAENAGQQLIEMPPQEELETEDAPTCQACNAVLTTEPHICPKKPQQSLTDKSRRFE